MKPNVQASLELELESHLYWQHPDSHKIRGMMRSFKILLCCVTLFLSMVALAQASVPSLIPERVLGKADAPVTVEEFVSLTCSHCAHFYNDILPELEKKYVETGKVRFILRDFPLDGISLKAAALARCMPEDEYYAFIKTVYKNQANWIKGPDAEKTIMQYARLGGLSQDKADACMKDEKMMDAIVTGRSEASQKYNIEATPTFVIKSMDGGVETIKGVESAETFGQLFDRLLAHK